MYCDGLGDLLLFVQSSLFQIFNTLVRASADAREAVLRYFARAINLNRRRAGMQVCRLRGLLYEASF